MAAATLAGLLALSVGSVAMAAGGQGNGTCDGDCDQQQLQSQTCTCTQSCTQTCTQSETCAQNENCVRNCAGQTDEDVAAGDNAEQAAGYSYGESGEGTGPGLNHEWGKSAH
jgi:hypothetical protein